LWPASTAEYTKNRAGTFLNMRAVAMATVAPEKTDRKALAVLNRTDFSMIVRGSFSAVGKPLS
jgi:hypothetical protein